MGLPEFRDRLVGDLLHPLTQPLGSVQGPFGIVVQRLHDLEQVGTGLDSRRDLTLLGIDAGQFLKTPRIGLIEVDLGAEEVTGVQGVGLATAGLILRGCREEFGSQEIGEMAKGLTGRLGVGAQLFAQRRRDVGGADNELVEVAARFGQCAGLFDDLLDLDPGRDLTAALGQSQGLLIAGHGGRDGFHRCGDGLPALGGVGGHEVEGVADGLQGRLDDVEARMLEPGLEVVAINTQTVTHRIDGHEVDVVEFGGLLNLGELGQCLDSEIVGGSQASGGEVIEAFGTLDAEIEGEGGGERK